MKHSNVVTKLEGICPCKVKLSDGTEKIVNTLIKVPAIYIPDWQQDGGFWHDEGWADYDIRDAEVVYPDEFSETINGTEIEYEGDLVIEELLEVISEGNLVIDL